MNNDPPFNLALNKYGTTPSRLNRKNNDNAQIKKGEDSIFYVI